MVPLPLWGSVRGPLVQLETRAAAPQLCAYSTAAWKRRRVPAAARMSSVKGMQSLGLPVLCSGPCLCHRHLQLALPSQLGASWGLPALL